MTSEHVEAAMFMRAVRGKTTITCVKCSKVVRVPPSRASRKFCSVECAGNAKSNIQAVCRTCGTRFKTVPARIADGRGRYCSAKCKHAGQSERMKGRKNPSYVDGGRDARRSARHAYRREAERAHQVSSKDLARLKDRQGGLCAACSGSLFDNGEHLDHITPLAKGGAHSIGNLQILCVECNLRKGAKPMAELRRRSACPSEDIEQEMVLRWAAGKEDQWPELGMLCHVPNGGYRSKRTASQMKRLGVKPGVPDLMLLVRRGGRSGLFIEMKRRKGGTLSPHQKLWIEHLNNEGFLAVVCRGHEEAIAVITDYLAADGGEPNED